MTTGPSRHPVDVGGDMDPEKIADIETSHRPRIYWLGCAVAYGCTCGARVCPCPVLSDLRSRLTSARVVRANAGKFR